MRKIEPCDIQSPERIISLIFVDFLEAGPIVAMIFVLRKGHTFNGSGVHVGLFIVTVM
jgi:hypothetical protein